MHCLIFDLRSFSQKQNRNIINDSMDDMENLETICFYSGIEYNFRDSRIVLKLVPETATERPRYLFKGNSGVTRAY